MYCILPLVLSLGFPQCPLLYKQASMCTVVLVLYNNIPVSDFTHSYLKCYLKIIILECDLMRVFECAITVGLAVLCICTTACYCIVLYSLSFCVI